jgi:hypothetical protein
MTKPLQLRFARAEDVDSAALTYAEVKAIASGNPLVIEKARVDAEVMRLTRFKKQRAITAVRSKHFAKHLELGAEYRAASRQGFATRRLFLPFLPHRLRVCLRRNVIICAVLAVLSAVPISRSHSESRTRRCGCADHH